MLLFRKKEFKDIDEHLKKGNYSAAMERMSKWQLAYLALFQEEFPHQKETLKHPDFTMFWQKRLESLSLNQKPSFHFQSQETIDDYDTVTGYVFYLLALKAKKESSADYNYYLNKAISHSSFHALQKYLHDVETIPTQKDESYCLALVETLQKLDPFINQLGSPGYLLLANGYLHIAIHAKNIDNSQLMIDGAFQCVWKYLNLALFAEKYSAAAIHNAYFGLGLTHSNPFNLPTLKDMLERCRTIAGDALPLPTQKLIKTQMLHEYSKRQEITSSPPHARI